MMSPQSLGLYLVHDEDRQMYVVASSYDQAIEMWTAQVMKESGESIVEPPPSGISIVARNDVKGHPEIIFPPSVLVLEGGSSP